MFLRNPQLTTVLNQTGREARTLLVRLGIGGAGGTRVILIHLVVIAVFGVLLPWRKGLEFLDPVMTSAYACLGVIFAAPAAGQAFSANPRPRSMTEALAPVVVAVLYGEFMAAAMLLAGLATVYSTHAHAAMFWPDPVSLALAGLLGVSGSFALAAIAGWITLRFSTGAARGALRVIFLTLLLVFFLKAQWLPNVAGRTTMVAVVLAVAAVFGLKTVVSDTR